MLTNDDNFEEENLLNENMDFDEVTIVSNTNISTDNYENQHEGKKDLKNSFSDYSSKVNWKIFFAICLFTLGAWLDISAIWSELVYLVDELPEGWRLPSILNVISVVAQLGPLLFSLGRYLFPKKFTFVRAIYFIFSIGLLSCLFLSLYWNKTETIFLKKRSIYLYLFNFTLSLLDGISTVTFLPYIGGYFSKEYIIPNYIGESLSSLIPGLFAIFQSIGVSDECSVYNTSFISNVSSNLTFTKGKLLKSHSLTPNYSVTVYFLIILFLLFGSASSFTYLHFSNTAKRARKRNRSVTALTEEIRMSELELTPKEKYEPEHIYNSNKKLYLLYFFTFMGSFTQYGYLPGLFSYSTIPYGNNYLHLSINLSSVCLPVAIFLSIWSYQVSTKRIMVEFLTAFSFAIYIVTISFQSPCPIFINYWFGGYLVVFCWVMCSCMFLRLRCLIATKLEKYGQNKLFIFGMFTIAGQVIGGTIIFINVDIYSIFKEKAKCSQQSIC